MVSLGAFWVVTREGCFWHPVATGQAAARKHPTMPRAAPPQRMTQPQCH